jgi:hypothetical protein
MRGQAPLQPSGLDTLSAAFRTAIPSLGKRLTAICPEWPEMLIAAIARPAASKTGAATQRTPSVFSSLSVA